MLRGPRTWTLPNQGESLHAGDGRPSDGDPTRGSSGAACAPGNLVTPIVRVPDRSAPSPGCQPPRRAPRTPSPPDPLGQARTGTRGEHLFEQRSHHLGTFECGPPVHRVVHEELNRSWTPPHPPPRGCLRNPLTSNDAAASARPSHEIPKKIPSRAICQPGAGLRAASDRRNHSRTPDAGRSRCESSASPVIACVSARAKAQHRGTAQLHNPANLVLLCRRHHTLIHHDGWTIHMGTDQRPWFLPPQWMDPLRQPGPAQHRQHDTHTTAA